MRRRAFLFSSFGLVACAAAPRASERPAESRRLAVTMDDPFVGETPMKDARARDAAILQALAAKGRHAALFVCGKRVDSPEGGELLARWSAAGHVLGNHSYSHRYFHSAKMSLEDFVAELDKGEAIV